MDVLWGPPSPGAYLLLLQSPQITILLTPHLWVAQYFLPYKKTQEMGQGVRKGSTNASCLLEGDNADILPRPNPSCKTICSLTETSPDRAQEAHREQTAGVSTMQIGEGKLH